MGGTQNTRARDEKCIQNFGSGNLKRRHHSEELGVVMKILLEWIFREVWWEGVDWMQLAQDRDQWRAHVNTVINLRIP
jgi:hypothetical protein